MDHAKLFFEFMGIITYNNEKASAMGVGWQRRKAFDLAERGWKPKVSEDVFGSGEIT